MVDHVAVDPEAVLRGGRTCGEIAAALSDLPGAVTALGELPRDAADPVTTAWRGFTAAVAGVLAAQHDEVRGFGQDLDTAAGTYRSVDGGLAASLTGGVES